MRILAPLLCAVALTMSGCTVDPGPIEPENGVDGADVRMAAVGDSITAANSPDFSAGRTGTESWVHYVAGEGIALTAGWARWGATTEEMARAVEPVTVDVLIIMAGTNDVALGVPLDEVGANLVSIARAIAADEVLIASIPPLDRSPDAATEFNRGLEDIASQNGWHWVDSAAAVRTDDGRFAPGTASDGVHPTARGAELIGNAIADAVAGLRPDN